MRFVHYKSVFFSLKDTFLMIMQPKCMRIMSNLSTIVSHFFTLNHKPTQQLFAQGPAIDQRSCINCNKFNPAKAHVKTTSLLFCIYKSIDLCMCVEMAQLFSTIAFSINTFCPNTSILNILKLLVCS